MHVRSRELAIGDVIRIHDWKLRVIGLERDMATAVRTAEFDFLLHFLPNELVDVVGKPGRG